MQVLIRADGAGAMGTGHVMRMIALADGVQSEGGRVHLASASLDETLEQRLAARDISISRHGVEPGSKEDAEWVAREAAALEADWVAADGYAFDATYQETLREQGVRLLLVDDYGHCRRYCADAVLNQNLSADESLYRDRDEHTRLLLGPKYALIRSEFLRQRPSDIEVARKARRLLVTMGGADPDDATGTIVAALERLEDPELRVRVIVGRADSPAANHIARLADRRFEALPAGNRMAEWMSWADLAIAAGGTTTAELCFMEVPALLVVLAENQRGVAAGLQKEGVSEVLGWHHELVHDQVARRVADLAASPDRRREMIERGRQRVDGRGATRIIAAMAEAS